MVVAELVVVMLESVGDGHTSFGQVDRFDVAVEKPDTAQQLADRVHDVRQVQVAGSHFMQHRSEQEEVFAVHQRHLDVRIPGNRFFQFQSSVHASKAAAQDQNLFSCISAHDRLVCSWRDPECRTPVRFIPSTRMPASPRIIPTAQQ